MEIDVKPKVVDQVKKEKEQEQKKLLTTRYRKGLKLFALNPDSFEVYEVQIEKSETFVVGQKSKSKRNANINPAHSHIWAMNKNNAQRKFKNIFFK